MYFWINLFALVIGAALMVPTTQADIRRHGMLKMFPDLGSVVLVATNGQQHDSIEEEAIINTSSLSSPLSSKQYRSDYDYNRKTDAFYKLHVESQTTRNAQKVCEAEGATLMVPTTQADIRQVHGMLKKFPDLGSVVLVATDGQQHDSIEEEAIINIKHEEATGQECDVVTRGGDIESMSCWRAAPFMCKVDARDARYDEQCGVYAKDYISKISTTGSCYKIPQIAHTWNEAYAECVAEGAHLVVLNSEGEHEEVTNLIQRAPEVRNAQSAVFFFAGIRANRPKDGTPRVFKTVLNQTLEEAGYVGWSDNEPNNYEDSEYCGSLFRNDGKYNDLGCACEFGFVCEKERQII